MQVAQTEGSRENQKLVFATGKGLTIGTAAGLRSLTTVQDSQATVCIACWSRAESSTWAHSTGWR